MNYLILKFKTFILFLIIQKIFKQEILHTII